MIHRLFMVLIIACAFAPAYADALREHLWKHRVILTFSAKKSAQERIVFVKQIDQYQCEFHNRNLVHLDLIAGSDAYRQLGERFSVADTGFRLVLVGKDGEVKLNTRDPSLQAVFALIDTMPMRKRERQDSPPCSAD